MRVRQGWSGETESNVWQKSDVELDEVDLQRMLADAEISAGPEKLSTSVAFKLLLNEAEFLLLGKLKEQGFPAERASNRQATLSRQNEAILRAVKSALA